MSKSLGEFVKDNSKFLRLSDGECFEGIYRTFKVVPSTFDPEKETCVYKLEYPDGKVTFFQTSSIVVAKTFSKFKGGETVKITREGEGNKTKYKISSPDIKVSDEDEELPYVEPDWVKD